MGRQVPALVSAFVLFAAGCGGSKETKPESQSVLQAQLAPSGESPKGPPDADGTARINLNTKTGRACWTLTVEGLDKPLSAHIHKGFATDAGPVVVPLGARFLTKGCVLAPRAAIAAIGKNPDDYYVNVHTRKFLNGAIRGQLHG